MRARLFREAGCRPESTNPYLNMILARYEENQETGPRHWSSTQRSTVPLRCWPRQGFTHPQPAGQCLKYVDRLIESRNLVDEALELRTKIYARKGDWNQAIKDTESLAKNTLTIFSSAVPRQPQDHRLRFQGAEKILRSLIGKDETTA